MPAKTERWFPPPVALRRRGLRLQSGIGVWLALVILVIVIQWAYFAILSITLFINHGNFSTEIAASVDNRDLHGRFKQDILKYYLKRAEELDVIMGEDRIIIEREKGVDKPSDVTLNPRFERPFLFGVVIAYEKPVELRIPALKGDN
ncbi:MAG: hypothetical protein K0U66_09580 [Gammaproteobacteria bacterium]|nr:hypothetical protein [Gammaproteobacteria bacterium]